MLEFKERISEETAFSAAQETSDGISQKLLNNISHPGSDCADAKTRSFDTERMFFHDILNMAGIVDGFSGLIDDAETLEEARTYAASAQRASKILVETIRHYRLMRDAETGVLRVRTAPVNVSALAEELSRIIAAINKGGNKNLNFECPAGLVMETDSVLLGRVLVNMLINAFEATVEGGEVRFTVQPVAGLVVFTVSNSITIPDEMREHLFHPDNSTRGYGHGLGLYSVKLLGEKYLGGKISCSSLPGAGTVFTAEFPVRAFFNSCA
ncbi:MAG: HAMP domain-containing sensor histidine kinase [Elusimicrobiaceae bacterium]|nr:HAMP domain-containing sensor histidine kinase [Elusimicrobiaceae bacterium]